MSRTDTAVRVISASPDRVYARLTDPDALAVWATAGRDDRPVEHFDKRPGGSCRLVLTYADASAARGTSAADSDVVDARFVEIVPAEGVTGSDGCITRNACSSSEAGAAGRVGADACSGCPGESQGVSFDAP